MLATTVTAVIRVEVIVVSLVLVVLVVVVVLVDLKTWSNLFCASVSAFNSKHCYVCVNGFQQEVLCGRNPSVGVLEQQEILLLIPENLRQTETFIQHIPPDMGGLNLWINALYGPGCQNVVLHADVPRTIT